MSERAGTIVNWMYGAAMVALVLWGIVTFTDAEFWRASIWNVVGIGVIAGAALLSSRVYAWFKRRTKSS